VIDPPVEKVRDVKGVVGLERVRVHNAARWGLLFDDWQRGPSLIHRSHCNPLWEP